MNYKLLLVIGVVALSAGFSATVEAACVYPSFENESGRCVSSQSTNQNYIYRPVYQPTTPVYYTPTTTYYQGYIAQLEQLLAQLRALQNQTVDYRYSDRDSDVEVTTRSASDVDEDTARLRGEVDFGRSDEATVYFEWGERRNDLDERTVRVVLDDNDDEDFSRRITRLDEDEVYYYRAVAIDEDGERDYGQVLSFRTDDDRNSRRDEEPEVDTEGYEDVRDDSAEIYGEVDMNDFDNGLAFFVWGEDESEVDDVDREDEYNDIDEQGDDLQKLIVDNDVDGRVNAWADIRGLDDDTRIYYRFCVEYEDEDDDETLECGSVRSFTTDD